MVKNLSEMQETQVWFLGWKDPLEKEMATHSSIRAWRIPWAEKPGRQGRKELDPTDWLTLSFSLFAVIRRQADRIVSNKAMFLDMFLEHS